MQGGGSVVIKVGSAEVDDHRNTRGKVVYREVLARSEIGVILLDESCFFKHIGVERQVFVHADAHTGDARVEFGALNDRTDVDAQAAGKAHAHVDILQNALNVDAYVELHRFDDARDERAGKRHAEAVFVQHQDGKIGERSGIGAILSRRGDAFRRGKTFRHAIQEQLVDIHGVADRSDAQPRRTQVNGRTASVKEEGQHQGPVVLLRSVEQCKVDLRRGDHVRDSGKIVEVQIGKIDVCL